MSAKDVSSCLFIRLSASCVVSTGGPQNVPGPLSKQMTNKLQLRRMSPSDWAKDYWL